MRVNEQSDHSSSLKRPANAVRKIAAYLGLVIGIGVFSAHRIQNDWLAPVTMIPPWMWLIPVAILVLIARSALSRPLLAAVLLVWLAFAMLYTEEARSLVRFRSLAQRGPNDPTIRVASLNCNIGSSKAALELAEYSPDIVLLQESPGETQLSAIATELLGEHAEWITAGDTSILTSGKIEQVSADRASHFCHAVVTLPDGRQGDIVSLRLSPPVFLLDFWSGKFWKKHHETRLKHREQLQAIVDHLSESAVTDCWIIGGDFNAVGGDGCLSPLESFQDTFHQSGSGWCNTGTSDYPLFRVDQIWVKGNVRSTVNKSFQTKHSDHRSVVADLLKFGE